MADETRRDVDETAGAIELKISSFHGAELQNPEKRHQMSATSHQYTDLCIDVVFDAC